MASVQTGNSYEAIGREEGLTRERIRQIVSESVRVHGDERIDFPRVQMARLEPALRITAAAVAKGRIAAIPTLLKILAQLDKYGAAFVASDDEIAGSHERLMRKINGALWRTADRARTDDAPDENLESPDSALQSPITP